MPFMGLGKPEAMLTTSGAEQHLPDDIVQIILELEKAKQLSNEENGNNSKLYKLCKFYKKKA